MKVDAALLGKFHILNGHGYAVWMQSYERGYQWLRGLATTDTDIRFVYLCDDLCPLPMLDA